MICLYQKFLLVADESIGRSVPFVFLERVKDDFKKLYGASIGSDHPLADDSDDALFEDRFSFAYNLDTEFGCDFGSLLVADNYHRADLKKAALARLSAMNRSLKVSKSGVKKKNRQASRVYGRK
ncbi:putative Longin domain-containing protein [Helianthus anomalus]